MSTEVSSGPENGVRYKLRTTLEVATVGSLALVIGPLALIGLVPAANFFGSRGASFLSDIMGLLIMLAGVLTWVLPFVAGFCYGFKRKCRLGFVYVLSGWVVGVILSSMVLAAVLQIPHYGRSHATTVANARVLLHWLLWLLWPFLFAILPTLSTMFGQRIRLRKTTGN